MGSFSTAWKTLMGGILLSFVPTWVPAQEAKPEPRPDISLWLSIKHALLARDGEEYFEQSFKGAMVPGGANGVQRFRAAVLSAKPSDGPRVLAVAIADTDIPEVTLNLDSSLPATVKPGANIWFQGIPVSFSKDPFMVTFDVRVDTDLKIDEQ